jgi:hypothetical protein
MSFIPDLDPQHTDYYITRNKPMTEVRKRHFCLPAPLLINPSMSVQSLSSGTLLLQFFNEPNEVEDDPLAFRGVGALRVEDALK